jgi:hypothetical protein
MTVVEVSIGQALMWVELAFVICDRLGEQPLVSEQTLG